MVKQRIPFEDPYRGLARGKVYHPSKCLPPRKIRKIPAADFHQSSELIGNLKPDEVVVFTSSYIPYGYREGPKALKTFPMALKRGPTVEIATPESLEAAIEEDIGPTRRRKLAFQSLDSEVFAMGLSWFSKSDNLHRRHTLNDVFEGCFLYAEAEREARRRKPRKHKILHIRDYGTFNGMEEIGAEIVIDVPSRTSDVVYQVTLDHAAFLGSVDRWVVHQLKSTHDNCGSNTWMRIKFAPIAGRSPKGRPPRRRKERDIVYDPHVICGNLKFTQRELVEKEAGRRRGKRIFPLQAFPLPTQDGIDVWKKLTTQAFFGNADRAYLLHDVDIEPELIRFFARHSDRFDSYLRMPREDRLANYDWEPDMPVRA